ncbi:Hypothetical predicted protein [Olea europaea subsp. europaea]|uniref:Uncharacterized protein n=1 Tax=Olea europaea subsp. europaea TaxID=158383 RepID=A0A8S0TM23_OLEEU|nr:Hypothetical predicted protein [Olea europaea subsp. europaea]
MATLGTRTPASLNPLCAHQPKGVDIKLPCTRRAALGLGCRHGIVVAPKSCKTNANRLGAPLSVSGLPAGHCHLCPGACRVCLWFVARGPRGGEKSDALAPTCLEAIPDSRALACQNKHNGPILRPRESMWTRMWASARGFAGMHLRKFSPACPRAVRHTTRAQRRIFGKTRELVCCVPARACVAFDGQLNFQFVANFPLLRPGRCSICYIWSLRVPMQVGAIIGRARFK